MNHLPDGPLLVPCFHETKTSVQQVFQFAVSFISRPPGGLPPGIQFQQLPGKGDNGTSGTILLGTPAPPPHSIQFRFMSLKRGIGTQGVHFIYGHIQEFSIPILHGDKLRGGRFSMNAVKSAHGQLFYAAETPDAMIPVSNQISRLDLPQEALPVHNRR